MEPRDESLMRKKKVIQILKTFQEEQPEDISKRQKKKKVVDPNENFGEQFNRIEKPTEKKSSFVPCLSDNL